METKKTVWQFIRKHALLTDKQTVLVAFSGGSDSVCLLHLLVRLGYRCVAAHCNFRLRGEESERDEAFAREFCERLGVEFRTMAFDTKATVRERKISIEMAARELRYQWFAGLANQLDINEVAVAHHADDSIETSLLNLVRGTGIKGLTGIQPRNGNIVRPLLCLHKEQITSYLQANRIPFVDDSSNAETIYRRNKIRHELLPLIERINPTFRQSLSDTMRHLAEVETVYRHSIDKSIRAVFSDGRIDIEQLLRQPSPEAVLFEILFPLGFHSQRISQIFNSLKSESGRTFFSDNHRLIKNRSELLLVPHCTEYETFLIESPTDTEHLPLRLEISIFDCTTNFVPSRDRQILTLDNDKIRFPLVLRRWHVGDRFVPFGMKGSKKVSDFFNDQKFSLFDKEQCWILESDSRIVWIVGHRADNRFRIDGDTKKIVQIKVE